MHDQGDYILKHDIAYRELSPRPDSCHIKKIEANFIWIGILGLHNLNIGLPVDFFAVFDGVPELPLTVVRINAGGLNGF